MKCSFKVNGPSLQGLTEAEEFPCLTAAICGENANIGNGWRAEAHHSDVSQLQGWRFNDTPDFGKGSLVNFSKDAAPSRSRVARESEAISRERGEIALFVTIPEKSDLQIAAERANCRCLANKLATLTALRRTNKKLEGGMFKRHKVLVAPCSRCYSHC
mmetsp:Transcript_36865/g.106293  ORF Transcript_36865/g.106293 Transcript_36865/m.106293 type:complete len:159 (+) Transcript_36865:246-722(+)